MASKNVELKFTALDRASAVISKITDKIEGLKNKMNQAQSIDPTKNAEKALSKMGNFAQGAEKLGKTMFASITLPIVGAGKQLVTSAADYQLALRDLQMRIDKLEPGQIEKLGKQARTLGIELGVGAVEATKAMTEFAKAGQSFQTLDAGAAKTALNLARSEDMAAGDAANLISNMLKVFDLDKDAATVGNEIVRVGDVLAKASGVSSISITELEQSMRHATSTASSYGLKVEQVAAAVATLGNTGVKGEMGGTTLRSLMNSIGGDPKRQAMLVAAGGRKEDFFNVDGTMKGFDEIFKALHGLNLSAEQFTKIFGKEFGGSIRKGALAFQEFKTDLDKVNDSKGFLSDLAQAKLDTFWGRWGQMKAAFKDIGAAMAEDGTLDMLKDFVTVIRDLLIQFNKMPSFGKKVILVFAGIAAIIGPAIWFLGSFAGALTKLIPLFSEVGLAGILTFGGWALAIVGIIAGLAYIVYRWDFVKKKWGELWDWCGDRLTDFVAFFARQVNRIIDVYNSLPAFARGEKLQLLDGRDAETRNRQADRDFVSSFTEPGDWKDFNPKDLIDNRNQSTINVNMEGVPWGTRVTTEKDYGRSKVNLDVGYTSKFFQTPVLGGM